MSKRITIFDDKLIPGLGVGPIHNVIVPNNVYSQLKTLGYNIMISEENINFTADALKALKEVPVEAVIEKVVEEVLEVEEETPVVDEKVEETVVEEGTYTEEELKEMTNSDLKEILILNEIEIPKNDIKANLIKAILGQPIEA